ncbi:acyl-CoA dehydrogenase family protein [Alkalilimnicola ehrlichii]|uniref:acyl-CoA dehydrogenase family protein n=1 Tax=Alkalilimnicola ehrlichii TaxID=351052 RepID=UPI001C6E515D|nr:acyl-CoA dehydrogenase family protein [Alkalilimnicola ehrlichii]
MADLETFRKETRAWLEENCPQSMRQPITSDDDACWGGRNPAFKSEDQRLWLERMAARGWTAPDWPKEYGGGGLSKAEAKILREEMARIKARPPLHSFGIWMIGPAILKFGSEALKRQHIPPIVRGEIRWCQGYSEPGAGSDLAGLQTRAEDKGDHFIVNGQKVWTSYANKADWMFCLVRTNSQVKKQLGISLVLFDMTTPGVSTRPIKLISGSSPFAKPSSTTCASRRIKWWGRSIKAGRLPSTCSLTSAK